MHASTLACGPFFNCGGALLSVVILLMFKPLAYYAFIQAFRYRVSRPIPMSVAQAVKLAGVRAGLGFVLVGAGAFCFYQWELSYGGDFWAYSWVYLYLERLLVWAGLGWYGAGLRGRRFVGWTLSGTALNAAFDFAIVVGVMDGITKPVLILGGIAALIAVLHKVGRRDSLKYRFSSDPSCTKCHYNLTGNLSGICPECGTPIVTAAMP